MICTCLWLFQNVKCGDPPPPNWPRALSDSEGLRLHLQVTFPLKVVRTMHNIVIDGLLNWCSLVLFFFFLKHLIPKLEFDVKESRCTTTFYSFPLFIQSRAMLMSCTTINLKAKQRRKKGLVALTWQLQKRKLTVTYILSGVESMQVCTGLHHYGMLLVYGTHQPPVHFWFKFREEKNPQCS